MCVNIISMENNIKLVLLDVDNTLLDFEKNSQKSLEITLTELGYGYKDFYLKVFKEINDVLWKDVELKKITREELHQIRFGLIFDKLSISGDALLCEKRFLSNLNHCTIFVDGAMDLVKYLSKKYVVCSASNAPYVQQVERLTNSGIKPYLKHIFVSEKIGYNKPDTRFYDYCFDKAKRYAKSETVMIGDSLSADILGGINYGIKTIWFNFENKPLNPNIKPNYIVNKLEEIKGIL